MTYRAEDLKRLVQGEHTDAVRRLEERATRSALGDWDGRFDSIARATLTAWTRAFGSPTAAGAPGVALDRIIAAVRAAVHRLLDQLGPKARVALRGALPDAVALGVRQGVAFVRAAGGGRHAVPHVRPAQSVLDEVAHVAELVADWRARALALLGNGQVSRWPHLLHAIGAARSAGSAVRAHAAWVLGRAVNAGLDAVADTAGTARLWVAEANACVRCLAYTGRVADDNGRFPGGLSWDPRQRHIGAPAIDGPPLHPHCRCRTVPWSDRWPGVGVPFPLALQREAQRSLAYGAARPSESRIARLRAARELLRIEPDLLPAVEARARTAVRDGRFPAAA